MVIRDGSTASNALRRVRHERGLRQRELAAVAGVSRSYIALLETGRLPGTEHVRQAVAQALGVPLLELWGPGR